MGCFYRLNERFCLRGYEKLPYALLRRPENRTVFLDRTTFWALSLCDGCTDCSLPLYPEKVRALFPELERQGIIRPCGYGEELTPDQRYRRFPNRYIESVHWSITGRCNYRCRHCYMSAPEAKLGELPHETILDILRQLDECGVTKVSLTGGEPLVRSDFEDIVRELTERRMVITQIYSNGSLVNDRLLDMLERYGQRPEFNMSYDGDEGMHDWLRGIPNAGESVLRAFDLCYARGFPTGSELCLHQKNKHLLRRSLNTLAAHHVRNCKVNPVSETELWLRTTGENASIGTQELFDLYLEYLPHYFEDGAPLDLMLGALFWGQKGTGRYSIPFEKHPEGMDCARVTVCGHARSQLYLSPEGRMLPCMSLSSFDAVQREYPLVTETGLQKGLSDSAYLRLIDTRLEDLFRQNPQCGACAFRTRCGAGCRACALDLTGSSDLMACDPAACLYFKGGYAEKLRAVLADVGTHS